LAEPLQDVAAPAQTAILFVILRNDLIEWERRPYVESARLGPWPVPEEPGGKLLAGGRQCEAAIRCQSHAVGWSKAKIAVTRPGACAEMFDVIPVHQRKQHVVFHTQRPQA
jgi:hypothetical protein